MVFNSDSQRFEIDVDDLSAADAYKEDIIRAVFNKPIYCNDLTAELWMFDMKIKDGVWLENIHPSNDLKVIHARLWIEQYKK